MTIHTWTGYYLTCDHAGCTNKVPSGHEMDAFSEEEHCYFVAEESDWEFLAERAFCPDHWTIDDDDCVVEVHP